MAVEGEKETRGEEGDEDEKNLSDGNLEMPVSGRPSAWQDREEQTGCRLLIQQPVFILKLYNYHTYFRFYRQKSSTRKK